MKKYLTVPWVANDDDPSIYDLEINGGPYLTFKLSVEIKDTEAYCLIYINDKEVWCEEFKQFKEFDYETEDDFQKDLDRAKQYCGEELDNIIRGIACQMGELKDILKYE